MLRVRALGPCTISGFHTLRSGEVCDVPAGRRDQVERLRIVGRLEFVEVESVAAEPSGNEAPADAIADTTSSSAPAALTEEELELAALEAELATAETAQVVETPAAPVQPKRALLVCKFCGKVFQDHAKGKPPADATDCAGMKALFKPAPAAP
jgi:hypothetical protein